MIFTSFSSEGHLSFAHQLWRQHLSQGDWAIDATCGNGHDALILSQCILKKGNGRLFCLDIQREALVKTKSCLELHLSREELEKISLYNQCHSHFPSLESPAQLIVYNLGYLPGGNKAITTQKMMTIGSLKRALELLGPRGALSVMCYPGHAEGDQEAKAILNFFQIIDNKHLSVFCYRYEKRPRSPFLIWVKKIS